MSPDDASTNDSSIIDDDLVAALGFEPTTTIEPISDEVIDVRDIDVRDTVAAGIEDSPLAGETVAETAVPGEGVEQPDSAAGPLDTNDSIAEAGEADTDSSDDSEVAQEQHLDDDAAAVDAGAAVADDAAAVTAVDAPDTAIQDANDEPLFGSFDSGIELFDIGSDDELGDATTSAGPDTGSELEVPAGLGLVGDVDAPPPVVNPSSLATLDEVFGPAPSTEESTIIGDPASDVAFDPGVAPDIDPAPQLEAAPTAAAVARTGTATAVAPAPSSKHRKLRARKVRRVVRHVDPWSVLTFSVLFHLVFFSSLLLASILVWNGAVQAGMIDNIENFWRELGDYETFNINSDVVFRAAVVIAGMLTLASSIVMVLLSVVFNLVSDLVGGIRITVVEEDTVVVPPSE